MMEVNLQNKHHKLLKLHEQIQIQRQKYLKLIRFVLLMLVIHQLIFRFQQ